MLTGGGRGGPTLLMLAYRGGEGGKNGEKDAYVICECSPRKKIYLKDPGKNVA